MLLAQIRCIRIVVLCLCWVTFAGYAQDDAPVHSIDGEFIKEWLVIGPFPKELDTDFLQAYGSEANIEPYEGIEIVAPNGETLTCKRYQSESDISDSTAR